MGNLLDTDILVDYKLGVNSDKITKPPWAEMCNEVCEGINALLGLFWHEIIRGGSKST